MVATRRASSPRNASRRPGRNRGRGTSRTRLRRPAVRTGSSRRGPRPRERAPRRAGPEPGGGRVSARARPGESGEEPQRRSGHDQLAPEDGARERRGPRAPSSGTQGASRPCRHPFQRLATPRRASAIAMASIGRGQPGEPESAAAPSPRVHRGHREDAARAGEWRQATTTRAAATTAPRMPTGPSSVLYVAQPRLPRGPVRGAGLELGDGGDPRIAVEHPPLHRAPGPPGEARERRRARPRSRRQPPPVWATMRREERLRRGTRRRRRGRAAERQPGQRHQRRLEQRREHEREEPSVRRASREGSGSHRAARQRAAPGHRCRRCGARCRRRERRQAQRNGREGHVETPPEKTHRAMRRRRHRRPPRRPRGSASPSTGNLRAAQERRSSIESASAMWWSTRPMDEIVHEVRDEGCDESGRERGREVPSGNESPGQVDGGPDGEDAEHHRPEEHGHVGGGPGAATARQEGEAGAQDVETVGPRRASALGPVHQRVEGRDGAPERRLDSPHVVLAVAVERDQFPPGEGLGEPGHAASRPPARGRGRRPRARPGLLDSSVEGARAWPGGLSAATRSGAGGTPRPRARSRRRSCHRTTRRWNG